MSARRNKSTKVGEHVGLPFIGLRLPGAPSARTTQPADIGAVKRASTSPGLLEQDPRNSRLTDGFKVVRSADLEFYKEKIVEMYRTSYAKIGLIPHFESYTNMSSYYQCMLVHFTDGIMDGAITLWSSPFGPKVGLVVASSAHVSKTAILSLPHYWRRLSSTCLPSFLAPCNGKSKSTS